MRLWCVQVILVNDASPNEDLREPLERYVKLLPRKVLLVRTKKREGLMRARMIGAGMATGDVLFFQVRYDTIRDAISTCCQKLT